MRRHCLPGRPGVLAVLLAAGPWGSLLAAPGAGNESTLPSAAAPIDTAPAMAAPLNADDVVEVRPVMAGGAPSASASSDPPAPVEPPSLQQRFADHVYRHANSELSDQPPHPLLRAVVVLRVRLDEAGAWLTEVLRDNPRQPAMTALALASVRRLPPLADLSAGEREWLTRVGLIDTWLFNDDGRYALRSRAPDVR